MTTRTFSSTLALAAGAVALVTAAATAIAAMPSAPDTAEHLVSALAAPVGDTTQVTVQVLSTDGTRASELVVVAVEGGDEVARMQRGLLVRQQLALLGVAPQQVFIEGARDE